MIKKREIWIISIIVLLIVTVVLSCYSSKRDLTEEELIEIALNDKIVQEEINNWSYEIGDIVFMEYEWQYKEEKIEGIFPVVPIYRGNKNESGVTLLVFINPEERTVINIGHEYRRSPLPKI
ncbi:MAG: hypothetical protein QMD22_03890 [archaeon]|nr:hypothetical protein [archaeon]